MIRGTTPTITITLPFAVSTVEKFRLYILQGNDTVLTKTEEDCTFSGMSVSVALTEEETYSLSAKKRAEIQARFLLTGGTVGGTKAVFEDVYDMGGEVEILTPEEDENDG
jgi:hypothetical protein